MKFCTSCQSTQPLEGGVTKQTKCKPRWVCAGCATRKKDSIYRNRTGRIANVPQIMADLYRGKQ